MEKFEQTLLENHLCFLSTHRGDIHRDNDTIFVKSDRAEFTYTLLGSSSQLQKLPQDTNMVQHFPWSQITTDQLSAAGFTRTLGISYMVLQHPSEWRVCRDLNIVRVETQNQMDLFSDVQSRGFNETQESHNHWHPWLRTANNRNIQNKNQMFYVGHLNGEPVGTALIVLQGETAGIYAVATLPQHRKKGISTAIMKQAIEDAKSRGAKIFTLQVKQDSYVEDFYQHLGFKRIFITSMYRHN